MIVFCLKLPNRPEFIYMQNKQLKHDPFLSLKVPTQQIHNACPCVILISFIRVSESISGLILASQNTKMIVFCLKLPNRPEFIYMQNKQLKHDPFLSLKVPTQQIHNACPCVILISFIRVSESISGLILASQNTKMIVFCLKLPN